MRVRWPSGAISIPPSPIIHELLGRYQRYGDCSTLLLSVKKLIPSNSVLVHG